MTPDVVIPNVLSLTTSPNPLTRWTACTSLKYAVASTDTRRSLRGRVDVFIKLVGDESLAVRQAALTALNTIVHVEPALVQHLVLSVPEAMDTSEGKVGEPVPPKVRAPHVQCSDGVAGGTWAGRLRSTVDVCWVKRRVGFLCDLDFIRRPWRRLASCRTCTSKCSHASR